MAGFWDFVPSLITAGATLWGADQASQASDDATNTAINATREATAAQVEANRMAYKTMEQQQSAASPGLVAMQGIVGRGEGLTPTQLQQMEDAKRTSLDALQGGSLRGSARASAAVVNDVEGRMFNTFTDANRNRADSAAQNLSNQYFSAGNNVAGLDLDKGNILSAGLMSQGQNVVDNTMTQAQIKGQAIGDIGAVIAGQLKDNTQKKRDSSYTPVGENIRWNNA